MTALAFHFDYLSPYAYLSWMWVRDLCETHGVQLVAEPTILGVLLAHHGHLGPAEIPPKRAFVFRDVLRLANQSGVPIEFPKVHPFNPLYALRVSLPEVAGDRQLDVIDALWRATWVLGKDVSTSQGVAAALDDAGFDGATMTEAASEPRVKEALRHRMERAIERGVFGVPTFVVDDELFWGNDQRGWLDAHFRGDRGYDDDQLQKFVDKPFGIRRPQ